LIVHPQNLDRKQDTIEKKFWRDMEKVIHCGAMEKNLVNSAKSDSEFIFKKTKSIYLKISNENIIFN
jgi:hypothetical protein